MTLILGYMKTKKIGRMHNHRVLIKILPRYLKKITEFLITSPTTQNNSEFIINLDFRFN